MAVPTSLTIPDADVDALVHEGRTLTTNNPTLRELLADFTLADTPIAKNDRSDKMSN
jgi:hypothetical protein